MTRGEELAVFVAVTLLLKRHDDLAWWIDTFARRYPPLVVAEALAVVELRGEDPEIVADVLGFLRQVQQRSPAVRSQVETVPLAAGGPRHRRRPSKGHDG